MKKCKTIHYGRNNESYQYTLNFEDIETGLRDISRKNQFLPGLFAQNKIFERDVSCRDGSRIFPKIDFKVLFIKIYQLNAICMQNYLWT